MAGALFSGATWARVVAVILVAHQRASGSCSRSPRQPWWSLIVLTLDMLVIYALTVHGRELKTSAR